MTKQEIKQLISGNCINDAAADDAVNKLYEALEKACMEWIPIDFDDFPQQKVLAASFHESSRGEKLYGYLPRGRIYTDRIYCIGRKSALGFITHYIDIDKHDLK